MTAMTPTQFKAEVDQGFAYVNTRLLNRVRTVNNTIPDVNGNVTVIASVGSVTTDGVTDMTTIGKLLAKATSQANARASIGAGTSSLTVGTTAGTALAGDTVVGTVNSPDATLLGRANHTGTQAISTITGLQAALDAKAATAALAGKADQVATADALATKLDSPGTGRADGKLLASNAGANVWVDPPAATSVTLPAVTYQPTSTDLAAVAGFPQLRVFADQGVFPIGDWATNAEPWSAATIKLTTNLSVAMSNHDHARNHDLPGFFLIDPNGDGTVGPDEGTVGMEQEARSLGDEWDMRDATGAMTGAWTTGDGSIARATAEAAMVPAGTPIYANVGKGVLFGPANKATPFIALNDIVSADAYPYTDPDWSTGGYPQCQYVGLPGSGGEPVRRAASYCTLHRRLRERLDVPKPTGQVIELSAQAGKATLKPEQAVGAAWASIIGGASFIIWFFQTPWIAPADPYNAGTAYAWPSSVTYDGKTWGTRPQVVTTIGVTPGTNDNVWGEIVQTWIGSAYLGAATQTVLAEFKARTQEIAAALRSDSLTHTATPGVNTRVVRGVDGLYLIAQPSHAWVSGTTYTLNFPAGTTGSEATVMWESRTEPVTAGTVSDEFANEYTTHVYRIGA